MESSSLNRYSNWSLRFRNNHSKKCMTLNWLIVNFLKQPIFFRYLIPCIMNTNAFKTFFHQKEIVFVTNSQWIHFFFRDEKYFEKSLLPINNLFQISGHLLNSYWRISDHQNSIRIYMKIDTYGMKLSSSKKSSLVVSLSFI